MGTGATQGLGKGLSLPPGSAPLPRGPHAQRVRSHQPLQRKEMTSCRVPVPPCGASLLAAQAGGRPALPAGGGGGEGARMQVLLPLVWAATPVSQMLLDQASAESPGLTAGSPRPTARGGQWQRAASLVARVRASSPASAPSCRLSIGQVPMQVALQCGQFSFCNLGSFFFSLCSTRCEKPNPYGSKWAFRSLCEAEAYS